MVKTTERTLDDRINLIADAVNAAKAKSIKRIVKQLGRMSPDDVRNLQRMIGKRR